MELLKTFMLGFVPLFFAMSPFTVLPTYIGITGLLPDPDKKTLLRNAILTAFVVSVLFLIAGKAIFNLLGITSDDFRIGGGIVLLYIAIGDLLSSQIEKRRSPNPELGIVPVGIPLIIGPAALTTILMLSDKYGFAWTLIALFANLFVVWVTFSRSEYILRIMRPGGTRAFGKVASLFLVAIAIMMVRVGLTNAIALIRQGS